MSHGRHVTMLTEGTYPHVHGGVSTWCDQLVRGMPEVDFNVIALTGSGREPVTWELPRNVYRHTVVPLWGATPRRGRRSVLRGKAHRRFTEVYETFLLSLLDPGHGDSPGPCANWPSSPGPGSSPRPCAPSPSCAC